MPDPAGLDRLRADIVTCRRCPRLVRWREQVALEKRAAYADQEYWGRPVPGFGDPAARIVLVGLAPAAHGGNRTGRVFTGDRSGDFLFAALHRCGLANQPVSVAADDGLALSDAYVTAVNRCVPPGNRPTPRERDSCLPFLVSELRLLDRARVLLCLGSFAWDGAFGLSARSGTRRPGRGRGSATGRSCPSVRIGCWAASTRASRTRSPAS